MTDGLSLENEVLRLRERVHDIGDMALGAEMLARQTAEDFRELRKIVTEMQIRVAVISALTGIGSSGLTALVLRHF